LIFAQYMIFFQKGSQLLSNCQSSRKLRKLTMRLSENFQIGVEIYKSKLQ
jgi:hypothetical protein